MKVNWFIVVLLTVQVLCAVFFVWTILSSLLGLPPISWRAFELIEIGAAVGLLLGVGMGAFALRQASQRARVAKSRLRAASAAFSDLLEEKFAAWGLTDAERNGALFAIKGLSTADIAAMRETSEGTVKAQTNAIYRKARVSGRPQLLSRFIDDLRDGPETDRTTGPAAQMGKDLAS